MSRVSFSDEFKRDAMAQIITLDCSVTEVSMRLSVRAFAV